MELVKDQIELPTMFKKYSYDDMKGLLEKWLETGQVEESKEEEETQPTEAAAPTTANATTADVKDAFEDLFNN